MVNLLCTEIRNRGVYCCVVIDVFFRRVVGWAIDSHQQADLATNA
ncbi:hypothetical protein [Nocardia abscessus]|nr:hypothetical protein [Nocardia abscessus]